jgi:hypothetical protein
MVYVIAEPASVSISIFLARFLPVSKVGSNSGQGC